VAEGHEWFIGVYRRLTSFAKIDIETMTIDELEREYTPLRQQALAVRSYL
jgi:hypothetical protein